MPNDVYVGRIRSSVTHALITIVTLGLYFYVWLFLIAHDVRRHRGRGAPPALLLILFLLVPVLGWFIAVWLTAGSIRKVQRGADADKLTARFVPSLWSLVPIVGWAVAGAILQTGANRAWDRLHRELDHATGGPTTVECPQCAHRQEIMLNPFAPNSLLCPQCGRTGEI